jgi:AcrR family transcriptional regulator
MVNRATFYRHYEDKSDLLERGTAEILSDLAERIRPTPSEEDRKDFDSARHGLGVVLDHVADHAQFYRIMLASESGWRVRTGIRAVVNEFLLQKIGSAHFAERRRLVPDLVTTRVVTSMIVGLVTWWIEERQPVSKDELIEYYLKLTVLGPYRCLGFDPGSVPEARENGWTAHDQEAT